MTLSIHLALQTPDHNDPIPRGMVKIRYGRVGNELRLVADLPTGPRRLVVRERPCGRIEPALDERGDLLPFIGGENPDVPCPLHEGRGRYEGWITGAGADAVLRERDLEEARASAARRFPREPSPVAESRPHEFAMLDPPPHPTH